MKSTKQQLTYPGTTVEAVAVMLADPAFREAVCDAQRVLRKSVSIDGNRVRIEQVQAADRLPSFAKKLVGDQITIVRDETWTSTSSGTLAVTIPGKPGEMTGTAALAQVGDDVVETVELDIKVGIPLVGGKLEEMLAELMAKALTKENEVGVPWLRDRAS